MVMRKWKSGRMNMLRWLFGDKKPVVRCSKCGGSDWSAHMYQSDDCGDWMEYMCFGCGYFDKRPIPTCNVPAAGEAAGNA